MTTSIALAPSFPMSSAPTRIEPAAAMVVGALGGGPCQQALATAATSCGPWVYKFVTGQIGQNPFTDVTAGGVCLLQLAAAVHACV